MATIDISQDFPWLLPPPADFAKHLKALRDGDGAIGAPLRGLANLALDENQLQRLARLVRDGRAHDLKPFKLGLVSNATTDFIAPAITGASVRYGLAVECVTAEYGQFLQTALDPNSKINRAQCDAVLLALDHNAFALATRPGEATAADKAVDIALDQLQAMCKGLADQNGAVIVQSVPPPPERLLGSIDCAIEGSITRQCAAYNAALYQIAGSGPAFLLDTAALAARLGLDRWHDSGAWNQAKQPFAHNCIAAYADSVGRLIGSMRGMSRKALVLDLDNTVWSGVIGDDGMDGINIAQGDPVGEAHLNLQRYALQLRDCGIVLAVSSKNTDKIARQVFRDHPDMLLREEHIAVFQANWTDKATNLRAIAKALNIGIDALVFVDDNPAERALVRREMPEVAVPEMPADPAFYVRTVAAAGYFEAVGFAQEDRDRAAFYQQNAKRAELQSAFSGLDDYLRSLNMVLDIRPFDPVGQTRIAQLINKSNQFNLTTRRYSEVEVADMASAGDVSTFQLRLTDSFGDNGMISVIICRSTDEEWEIDSWLMSCRVLGRRVEEAALATLAQCALEAGASRLRGVFKPTERNGIVADLYARLGFSLVERQANGEEHWVLQGEELESVTAPDVFSRIDIHHIIKIEN